MNFVVLAGQERRTLDRMDEETRRFRERIYRLRNAETIRAKAAAYRDANREKLRAYGRARYLAKREKLLKQNAEYRKAHWDSHLANMRRRYSLNRDVLIERSRKYRESHRDRTRENARRWASEHLRERAHAERLRIYRKRGNGGSHTLEQWLEKCALFSNCCAYCGEARVLTRDHRIPLARGGTSDITNIVPACRSCNAKKRTMTDIEFLFKLRRAA